MNRFIKMFIMMVVLLCTSLSSVFAQGSIEGDYLSDVSISSGFTGTNSYKEQATTVTKNEDNTYNVNLGSFKVASYTLKLNFKNLEYNDNEFTYGSNSNLDGADGVTVTSFSLLKKDNDEFYSGNIALTVGVFLSCSIELNMKAKPTEETPEPTPVKVLEFKKVPYFNNINNVNKTKDEFESLTVSVFENSATISSAKYIVKLSEEKNLKTEVALNFEELTYTAENDYSTVTINNASTMLNIPEYGIAAPTTVNATFSIINDTIVDGTFSYSIEGNGGLIDLVTGGTKFDVTCHFGDHTKDIDIVEDKFDFDFNTATHYFASVADESIVEFNHVYLSNDAKTLVLYPIKLSGISQEMAMTFDIDTTNNKIYEPYYYGASINFNNIKVKANGNAKQFIKSNGNFSEFGSVEAVISGVLSADEQFVGKVQIGGNLVEAIDTKAPVIIRANLKDAWIDPVCGAYASMNVDSIVMIDTIDGPKVITDIHDSIYNVYETLSLRDDNRPELTVEVKDKAGNIAYLTYDYNVHTDYKGELDINLDASATKAEPYTDATKEIESAVRKHIGTADCDYEVEIPESASRITDEKDATFEVNVRDLKYTVKVAIEKPTSAPNIAQNEASLSYKNGTLFLNGYNADTVEIFNLLGTKVLSSAYADKVSVKLNNGVYLVKVGEKTEKIVIK